MNRVEFGKRIKRIVAQKPTGQPRSPENMKLITRIVVKLER
jgi:hypothetical protein